MGSSNGGFQKKVGNASGQSILQSLLFELAVVLLPRGVTPTQFNDLAKHAFIDAAASLSNFRNGKINQSRVSVLTGLRRAEVRKLLGRAGFPTQPTRGHLSPIETVIAGWCSDKRYVDRHGGPKRLAVMGVKNSFAFLVKQYAGDVPHRAVLNELSRLGVIHQIGQYVEVTSLTALRRRRNFASLAYLMPAIVDGIRLASRPQGHARASAMRRLVLPAYNLIDLEMVRERCTSSIDAMLTGLSGSLVTRSVSSRQAKHPPHSCTVSVLFVENRGS